MSDIGTDALTLRYARGKLAGYTLGGFAFAAVCAWMVWSGMVPHGSFEQAAIGFGVLFFGAIGVLSLRRMANSEPVITISKSGIWDTRISDQVIPWPAIHDITMHEMHRQKFVMLHLDPAFERTMKPTRAASFFKPLNSAIGFKGHPLNVAGMNVPLGDVIAAIEHFGRAHGDQVG